MKKSQCAAVLMKQKHVAQTLQSWCPDVEVQPAGPEGLHVYTVVKVGQH